MKTKKGITLISLNIYIILLLIVVGILSVVSQNFYSNASYVDEIGKYVSEFNKFNMYFVKDVKNNSDLYSVTENKIVFEDGTIYTYFEGIIYRNKIQICKNIMNCVFERKQDIDDNNFTKKIINVKLKINGSRVFETENDYVLKYW